jgi:hypothetical protein
MPIRSPLRSVPCARGAQTIGLPPGGGDAGRSPGWSPGGVLEPSLGCTGGSPGLERVAPAAARPGTGVFRTRLRRLRRNVLAARRLPGRSRPVRIVLHLLSLSVWCGSAAPVPLVTRGFALHRCCPACRRGGCLRERLDTARTREGGTRTSDVATVELAAGGTPLTMLSEDEQMFRDAVREFAEQRSARS